MKVAIVTGANQGIGWETARQLIRQGYFVYLGCRKPESGIHAIEALRKEGLETAAWIRLDVTDEKTIGEAADEVARSSPAVDALINNAGILGARPVPGMPFPVDEIRRVFDTNVFGVIRVTQAFLPLLSRSEAPRIVNVSSGLGSLTLQSDPTWRFSRYKHPAYVPSKAALNAYTVVLSAELAPRGFKVNAVDPGHTARHSTAIRERGAPRLRLLSSSGPRPSARTARAADSYRRSSPGARFPGDRSKERARLIEEATLIRKAVVTDASVHDSPGLSRPSR
jgi:NAD(P)-dependent dehydrogenase (short-subunit alcohol dehydrogenase family)